MSPSSKAKRRGVFYSPSAIVDVLVQWAVRAPSERILEPSFGGCEFLSCIEKRLTGLSSTTPWKQMFGCDVDATAFKRHLALLRPEVAQTRHFLKEDFLTLRPSNFLVNDFDVLIGNPPYVSHHNMFLTQRASRERVERLGDFRLSRIASLWGYFVLHGLRFLKNGGRMAWLLPGSALHANYAKELLREVSRHFERTAVISIEQRLFLSNGTSEATHILLCDERGSAGPDHVEIVTVKRIEECINVLTDWSKKRITGAVLNGRAQRALTPAPRLSAFNSLSTSEWTYRMDDVATLSIGIVTGANKFFLVNEEVSQQHKLPKRTLHPILAKLSIARTLNLTPRDFHAARIKGIRCLLIVPRRSERSRAVNSYFDGFPEQERLSNVTFAKRQDWRLPDDGKIPDAFLPYMHNTGPRIILNGSRVNSTNTIHRLFFKPGVDLTKRKLIAISMMSSFSQISAEIEGRSYGGGILKHEIGEASSIQLLLPNHVSKRSIDRTFKRIGQLLRRGDEDGARTAADSLLASHIRQLRSRRFLKRLDGCLKHLRRYRKPHKKTNPKPTVPHL
jgi:adenine-specific DNA methylase